MKSINNQSEEFPVSSSSAKAHWHPDPLRAHGAWIYLFASIGAGALVGAAYRVEPAMLAGTGFAGAFLVIAAIDVGPQRKLRQVLLGASLAIVAPLVALWLGAEPVFLNVAALTVLPVVSVVVLARTCGTLSPATLGVGVMTLTLSAPVAAMAGGSSALRAAVLFGLLWPFFSWRTLRVNASLPKGTAWNRAFLRAQGLREALIAAVWTLTVAMGLRLL